MCGFILVICTLPVFFNGYTFNPWKHLHDRKTLSNYFKVRIIGKWRMLDFSCPGTCGPRLIFSIRILQLRRQASVIDTWQHGCEGFGSRNDLFITGCIWNPGEFLYSLPLFLALLHWVRAEDHRFYCQECDNSQHLGSVFYWIPQWEILGGTTWTVILLADFSRMSVRWAGECPLAPPASWVSSRPSDQSPDLQVGRA